MIETIKILASEIIPSFTLRFFSSKGAAHTTAVRFSVKRPEAVSGQEKLIVRNGGLKNWSKF